jgi:hypothetical protein
MTDEEILRALREAKPGFIKQGGLLPPESGIAHLVTSGLDGAGPNRHLPRKPNEGFGLSSPSSAATLPAANTLVKLLVQSDSGTLSAETKSIYTEDP